MRIKHGDRVYWTDPDNGIASGPGTVRTIHDVDDDDDPMLVLDMDDGGVAEVWAHEVRPHDQPKAQWKERYSKAEITGIKEGH
jgi:hypothetical protein